MCRHLHYLRAAAVGLILVALPVSWLPVNRVRASGGVVFQTARGSSTFSVIRDLIYRQKYDEAITGLEQVLENNPRDGEALTYMATANLYHNLNFTKAEEDFEHAFKAGGGATFFVTHSHEKINTDDVVDYCRGWLHLRADGVEYVPTEGPHGFKSRYNQVEEIKQNRLSKITFHIKVDGKSQNFRGRSNRDLEALLITALFKSFAQH
jgi:tetratricopeptide (TPR) repeat protein